MQDVHGYTAAGLAGSEEMARFLWDSGIAAVACDNPAVEVVPGDPSVGFLHARLIPCLGMAIGELFSFGPLAAACERAGRSEFLFVSVPLNVTGAWGRPPTRSRSCSVRRGSRAGFCGPGPMAYSGAFQRRGCVRPSGRPSRR